jgi:hypothetical protein
MNSNLKKILIFGGIVIVLAAISVFLVLRSAKTPEQAVSNRANERQNVPTLPENEVSQSPDLGEVKKETQSNLASEKNSQKEISEKVYEDKSGKIISLVDFAKANGLKIDGGVVANSSQKDFMTFSCPGKSGDQRSVGIMLQLRRDVDAEKYRLSYPDMEKNMKNWEKNMFSDLASLFFPGESFSKEPAFNVSKYITSNGVNIVEIRYANLEAVSGKQYSVDWGFLGDQVFVSNDKDCLRRELDNNADAYEP